VPQGRGYTTPFDVGNGRVQVGRTTPDRSSASGLLTRLHAATRTLAIHVRSASTRCKI